MKVYLTESQFKYILSEERVAQFLCESLSDSANMEELKSKIRKALSAGVAIATIIMAINKIGLPNKEREKLITMVNQEQLDSLHRADSIHTMKVKIVDDYIASVMQLKGKPRSASKLSAEEIVNASEENNFDLPWLMGVMHIEGHYATEGRPAKTNSAFSVGLFDDGSNRCVFSNPNESIQPYINLIRKDYLRGGKPLYSLLQPGCFVNFRGDRYASNPQYESDVLRAINRFKKYFDKATQTYTAKKI